MARTDAQSPEIVPKSLQNCSYLSDLRLYQRVRYLPRAIEHTKAKLARLAAEAEQLGLKDLADKARQ